MRPTSLVFLALLLPSCVAIQTATPPAAVPELPLELPLELRWTRQSAEYPAAVHQTYVLAGERLTELVADREPGTWAVALDADETVISNSLYELELAEKGETYSPATWKAWAERGEATALPGARDFLLRVRKLGGKIAIVTNRRDEICPETAANFGTQALPFDVMLCKRDDSRKESRWRQVEDGTAAEGLGPLEIVMWLGDNIQDFPEGHQEQRLAPVRTEFGRTYFVLPNPMYGSWTG